MGGGGWGCSHAAGGARCMQQRRQLGAAGRQGRCWSLTRGAHHLALDVELVEDACSSTGRGGGGGWVSARAGGEPPLPATLSVSSLLPPPPLSPDSSYR